MHRRGEGDLAAFALAVARRGATVLLPAMLARRFGLVLTPMVMAAGSTGGRRSLTAEQAGERVVRALEGRPLTMGTTAGRSAVGVGGAGAARLGLTLVGPHHEELDPARVGDRGEPAVRRVLRRADLGAAEPLRLRDRSLGIGHHHVEVPV